MIEASFLAMFQRQNTVEIEEIRKLVAGKRDETHEVFDSFLLPNSTFASARAVSQRLCGKQPDRLRKLGIASLLSLAFFGLPQLLAAFQAMASEQVPVVSKEAAESAAAKFRQIEESSPAGRSFGTLRFSEAELNSYLHYDMESEFPPGISKPRVKLQPGRPQGFVEIDFDKLKSASKNQPNPIVDYLLRGVHTLSVEGTLTGSKGTGQFHLETVSLDGITMPRVVVDYLIEHYLKPRYPEVAIDRPFALPFPIDKLTVDAGSLELADRTAVSAK